MGVTLTTYDTGDDPPSRTCHPMGEAPTPVPSVEEKDVALPTAPPTSPKPGFVGGF